MQKTELEIQRFRTRSGLLLFLFSFGFFFFLMSQCSDRKKINQSLDKEGTQHYAACGNMNISTPETKRGKVVYNFNCAACHFLNRNMTGPALEESFFIYGNQNLRAFILNEDSLRNTSTFEEFQDRNLDYPPFNHHFQISKDELDDLISYLR